MYTAGWDLGYNTCGNRNGWSNTGHWIPAKIILSGGAKFCPIIVNTIWLICLIYSLSAEVYCVHCKPTQPELLPFHPVPQREVPLKQQLPQILQKTNVFPQPDKHICCCGHWPYQIWTRVRGNCIKVNHYSRVIVALVIIQLCDITSVVTSVVTTMAKRMKIWSLAAALNRLCILLLVRCLYTGS